jgi:hypothetical protein
LIASLKALDLVTASKARRNALDCDNDYCRFTNTKKALVPVRMSTQSSNHVSTHSPPHATLASEAISKEKKQNDKETCHTTVRAGVISL